MSAPARLREYAELPQPGPIRPFHLPPVEGDRTAQGLFVRSMQRTEVPLVSGCLVLDAGEATVQPSRAGLAVLSGDVLTGGTEARDASELAEALEGLGVSLRVSTGWDATTLSFTCVAERLDETLEILSEVIRTPAFPESEVARVRRQRLAAIRQRWMDPAHLAIDELDRTLFPPEHPYHRPLSGELETVEALDREAARGFAASRYRPNGSGFVIVGDLTGQEVMDAAERHLDGWRGKVERIEGLPPVRFPAERPVVIIHRPGAVQSEIRLGQPGPARSPAGEAALDVGNAILGGAFTSRLNLNLREKHGFTYGVRSSFSRRRHGGSFVISTAVQTDMTVAALEQALLEFRGFMAEGPTEEEVRRARDYLAGVFPLRMETAAQLAARLAELVIFDLPDDYHHEYRGRIREVEPAVVKETMSAHLDPERAAVVIVGDAQVLQEPLEALGLGAVEVRTAPTLPRNGTDVSEEGR